MKIETRATVVGVGRESDAGPEVTLETRGQSFRLKVDRTTAQGFATKLYQDVRVVVDASPEDAAGGEPEDGDTDYERLVRKPRRLAQERHPVFAVGVTVEDAIRNYAVAMGWGEVEGLADLPSGDPCFTWGRVFTAVGTGFKAAGWHVPGGAVLTWWK